MVTVEGTIFAFIFSKKYNLSLLLMESWVLDRCRHLTGLPVSMPTSAPPLSHVCLQNRGEMPDQALEGGGGRQVTLGKWDLTTTYSEDWSTASTDVVSNSM
jgi:hypothetical protein